MTQASVIDLDHARRKRTGKTNLRNMFEFDCPKGLASSIALAATRAYTVSSAQSIMSPAEASRVITETGDLSALTHVRIQTQDHEQGRVFYVRRHPTETVYCFVGDENVEYTDEDIMPYAEAFNLSEHEAPSLWVAQRITSFLETLGLERISVFGLFAIDLFFFALSNGYEARSFLHERNRQRFAVNLYDPEEDQQVILIASYAEWSPTPADLEREIQSANM